MKDLNIKVVFFVVSFLSCVHMVIAHFGMAAICMTVLFYFAINAELKNSTVSKLNKTVAHCKTWLENLVK